MKKLLINTERCKGCGLCIKICPKGVLAVSDKLNKRGVNPVIAVNEENCISCALCAIRCPDYAIEEVKR